MKNYSMEITIAVSGDFPDDATQDDIRERLGDEIDALIENTDLVYTLIKQAPIQATG